MPNTEADRLKDFVDSANDFKRWIYCAEEAYISAGILREKYNEALNDKSPGPIPVPPGFSCMHAMIFLYSIALELYLKAVIASRESMMEENGKYKFGGHNLRSFACRVGITLTGEEGDFLELLQDFIETWGKYPVPMKLDKWRNPIILESTGLKLHGGVKPTVVWSESYFLIYNDFLEKKVLPLLPCIKRY